MRYRSESLIKSGLKIPRSYKTKKEDYNMGMSAWEIKKAKEEVKKIKKLEKAKKDAEFYRGMVESDVKAGRDPFNSRIKYEAAIKECERLK